MFALAGCAGLQNSVPTPKARIQSVDLKGLTLSAATLAVGVEVTNPYSKAIPVIDIEYALSTGGERFLEGNSQSGQSIPANGSAVVPFQVSLPYQALMNAGARVSPGATIPYRADLTLNIDTPILGVIRVPTGRDGEVRIPTFP